MTTKKPRPMGPDDYDEENLNSTYADEADDLDYDVGYKRPPRHSRFKPGNQAAKGHGRKSAKNSLTSEFDRQLGKRVEVKLNGKKVRVTNRQLIAHQVVAKATRGDIRAAQMLMTIGKEDDFVVEPVKIEVGFIQKGLRVENGKLVPWDKNVKLVDGEWIGEDE